MMLAQLSFEWATVFAVLALMAGYLVGQAMDGVMGRLAFGPIGNMVILTVGFYLGLMLFERSRLAGGIELHFVAGVSAAFLCLVILATLKRLVLRL